MIVNLTIDSQKLVRFLKRFKLSPLIYLRVQKGILKAVSVDYKDYLGVLEAEMELLDPCDSVDFSLDSNLFLSKLEMFKGKILLAIDLANSFITIKSQGTKSYSYKVQCETGSSVSAVLNMKIVDQTTPRLCFTVGTQDLLESFKALTNVDNLISWKFIRNDPIQIILTTTKTENLSVDLFKQKVSSVEYYSQEPVICTQIYCSAAFSLFLKEGSLNQKVSILESFMVVEGVQDKSKVYIPLREVESGLD